MTTLIFEIKSGTPVLVEAGNGTWFQRPDGLWELQPEGPHTSLWLIAGMIIGLSIAFVIVLIMR